MSKVSRAIFAAIFVAVFAFTLSSIFNHSTKPDNKFYFSPDSVGYRTKFQSTNPMTISRHNKTSLPEDVQLRKILFDTRAIGAINEGRFK